MPKNSANDERGAHRSDDLETFEGRLLRRNLGGGDV